MTLPKKKITIITAGTRGSVQGVLALALGLRDAGHQVKMCAGENLKSYVLEKGVEYAHLDDKVQGLANANEFIEQTQHKSKMLESIRTTYHVARNFRPSVVRMLHSAWEAVQGSDAIVYRPHATGGHMLAQRLGVPSFLVEPAPLVTPTREFRNFMLPDLPLGNLYNRISYSLFDMATSPLHRALRKGARGLPGAGNGHAAANGRHFTVFNTFSPHVLDRPRDWPEWSKIVGWLFIPTPSDWAPPRELVQFLEAGPPPVYVGFGSMARDPQKTTEMVLETVKATGYRFLLATGWGGLDPGQLPDRVFQIRSVPHDWLFPRVAAVVHHSGAGTVGNGLHAGKPTVCCPFLGDQYFWGDAVYRLGAGPRPIPRHELNAERLTEAIRLVMTDQDMCERARRLGQKLRPENGVARAIEIIETQLETGSADAGARPRSG